ncbi:hypothetical protein N0V93_004782 [Gnomoniopsis smithogilvyi]|uniref:C2H2-type domain-containing protein n=1 Tax=Gnomoniopsis smithogilvyi TaxID=1191159 RepID=A0A9W8YRN6_9PEZI|nr:hypothetical protein N0V93_004782 [Gnomoniopsis smithogilvyi]
MPSEWYEQECGTCGKEFPTGWHARDQHCKATGHSPPEVYKCNRCERSFRTYDSQFQHMEAKNHFQYKCRQCYETWPSEEQRREHEANDHYLCAECDRKFNSRHDVRQHLRSRIHIGCKVSCPLCNKAYTTATGVTHHIESGSCPKATNMNRDTLYTLVRAHDPKGAVSKKLIGWHGEERYEATDWAWNGSGYECFYFCHKSFRTLQSLNQHLASPVHQQALYHCPSTRCAKDFKILGGLINHLESEMCGAMRFDKVQAGVESLIRGGRLLM